MLVHELGDDSLSPQALTTLSRTTLRLLRLASLGHLDLDHADSIARWVISVHRAHGWASFRAVMEYVARAGKDERMMDTITRVIGEDMGEPFVSAADKLEMRGQRKLLLAQLEHRFDRISPEVEGRVRDASEAQLQRWGVQLLDATVLDEIFAEP